MFEDKNENGIPDAWEEQLTEFMGRETFVSKMQKASKREPGADEMSFASDIINSWPLYLFLAINSIFTMMLGFYLGTAPKLLPDGSLFFHTDPAHFSTALMYMLAFVAVTEFPFALAKWWYYTREFQNRTQAFSMLAMMIVSAIAILATGIAGGIVVASTISFLTDYVAVPEWAQWWIVRAIPVLFIFYAVLLTVYKLSSRRAESLRMTRGLEKARELDGQTRKAAIQQMMAERLALAEGGKYVKMVEEGLMTAAQARARMDADNALAVPVEKNPRAQQTRQQPPILQAPPQMSYSAEAKSERIDPNGNGRH